MLEFDFIARVAALFGRQSLNGFEGIGDDCAVLPVGDGESLVFTTDLLAQDVHFQTETCTPEQLGAKALAVNLSDVAAMGARPVATLLSLSLPATVMATEWPMRFMEGYRQASEHYLTALVGGDTTLSKCGITISITAIGRVADGHLKRRSDARAGDVLYVTAPLGGAAAGLRDLQAGRTATPVAMQQLVPEAQTAEGAWLGGRTEVHAMMDLSDGLASDVPHLLTQSGVSVEIDLDCVPVAAGATLEEALCGGEDYKLLFTVDAAAATALQADFRRQFGVDLYPIGRMMVAQPTALHWLRDGVEQRLDLHGFMHFQK